MSSTRRASLLMLACAAATAAADYTTPRRTVNLDLPPADRWTAIVKEYAAAANVTLQWLDDLAGPGKVLHPVVEALKGAVLKGGGWSDEYLAEMQGVADAGGFRLDDVQLANLFYEFGPLGVGDAAERSGGSSGRDHDRNHDGYLLGEAPLWGCTSIAAQHTNGSMLHARNQDYSMPGLANITLTVDFTRGGKVVYTGNTFVGYIGLPTAMRPGSWSVSCDSRFSGGADNLLANIAAAEAGAKTIGVNVREMLETQATYADLVAALNTTHVIAPAYYIVAGTAPGQGAVVTRNRTSPDQSAGEGIWSLDTAPASWWRLETNWDHWLPDNVTDGRRKAANAGMAITGQNNVDFAHLHSVLSTPPVLAPTTVYTAFMFPEDGLYHAITREH